MGKAGTNKSIDEKRAMREKPGIFDPFYDYYGLCGDVCRPVLPSKPVKVEGDIFLRSRGNQLFGNHAASEGF